MYRYICERQKRKIQLSCCYPSEVFLFRYMVWFTPLSAFMCGCLLEETNEKTMVYSRFPVWALLTYWMDNDMELRKNLFKKIFFSFRKGRKSKVQLKFILKNIIKIIIFYGDL